MSSSSASPEDRLYGPRPEHFDDRTGSKPQLLLDCGAFANPPPSDCTRARGGLPWRMISVSIKCSVSPGKNDGSVWHGAARPAHFATMGRDTRPMARMLELAGTFQYCCAASGTPVAKQGGDPRRLFREAGRTWSRSRSSDGRAHDPNRESPNHAIDEWTGSGPAGR